MSELGPNDLQVVLTALCEHVGGEWENIGLALGLKSGILDGLKGDHKRPGDCLRDMLKEWLNRSDDPSWQSLIRALRNPSVGRMQLANALQAKYCPPPAGIQFTISRTCSLIDTVVTIIAHLHKISRIVGMCSVCGSCFCCNSEIISNGRHVDLHRR